MVLNRRTSAEFGWSGYSFRYDGQVDANGYKCGYGRLQCIDGYIYEGHWSDNGTICNGRSINSLGLDYYIGANSMPYRMEILMVMAPATTQTAVSNKKDSGNMATS